MIFLNLKLMFIYYLIGNILLNSVSNFQITPKKQVKNCAINYQFKISLKNKYCGGARPSQEIIDLMNTLEIYSNKEIYIFSNKNGKSSLISKAKTNDEGLCTFKLKKGNYCIGIKSESNCIKPYLNEYESYNNYNFNITDLIQNEVNEVIIEKGCGSIKMQ